MTCTFNRASPRASPRSLGAALATLTLVGSAVVSTGALADGRWGGTALSGSVRIGPAFHGPRVGPGYYGGRPDGHYHGPHGHWGGYGHGYGYGYGWSGLALGLGIGALIVSQPWDPVIVERPTYLYAEPPALPPHTPLVGTPVPSRAVAEPIVYPSKGQSVQQTEADRQDCNRWATTQPSAMADASIFQRATAACLEGRGYTVR